ncbi:MAG: type I restriction enzyme HsdR N-terminal domain-containing protein [Chloroflexi bacterium]|nr:type I restriction enzyme HsdR N-terminal domain-containing protein [Chloroflexota bacterium]
MSATAGAIPLHDFDFSLLDSPDFKEDSVREEIIIPMLRSLGYSSSGSNRIIRSKTLLHPFITIGSKRRPIQLVPDYLLSVNGNFIAVLDAKAPNEEIKFGDNLEQVYSYAVHPEIRAPYFALCNGKEFALYAVQNQTPVLCFSTAELDQHWDDLQHYLAPAAASTTLPTYLRTRTQPKNSADFDYLAVQPPPEIIGIHKQTARRHFGVHGYFTKQVWKVVRTYIETLTQRGDVVLDPFGGSGVTLVEALLLGRKAIHIDLNPLSIFIVKNLIEPVDLVELGEAFQEIRKEYKAKEPKTDEQVQRALKRYSYPHNTMLPKNADVDTVEKLFTPKQLAQLALLRHLIRKRNPEPVQDALLLMFSGLLNKINLTYHSSEGRSEGRGDSGVFRYYRYRIAPKPAAVDVMRYFKSRLERVIAAKKELAPFITCKTVQDATIRQGTATDLHDIPDESVDYIYTDPPYGSKIPYLDLSVMWNAWLDLPVTDKDYENEAIEGGEHNKTKQDYSNLLAASIQEMARVLKYDRWMSFVFAHQNPAYWHLIVDSAEKAGFEYAGAVKQNNGQTSFKKRQNPFTVLSGQLIINFRKVRNPRTIGSISLGAPIMDIVVETIESVIAMYDGATLEQINDELVLRGLELGFLDVLAKEYADLTPLLVQSFDYDDKTRKYHIRPDRKFKSRIPLELRVRYFVVSYLKRLENRRENPTFEDVVLNIMPLLKNGVTPERQTIRNVLESVAERVGTNRWRLARTIQGQLL